MFFVRPQCYNPRRQEQVDFSDLCLINNINRQKLYRQQLFEKRLIQKANQPQIERYQDTNNYYLLLRKDNNLNMQNIQYITRFSNNYQLKELDSNLVVRSVKDNFYKSFSLPNDMDSNKDITFRVLKNGYVLEVSIPKRKVSRNHNQIENENICQYLLKLGGQQAGIPATGSSFVEVPIWAEDTRVNDKRNNNSASILAPSITDSETLELDTENNNEVINHNVLKIGGINKNTNLRKKDEEEKDEGEDDERCNIDSSIQRTYVGNNGDLPETNIIEPSKLESSLGNKDLLKNYETTSRKSAFPPTASDDEIYVSEDEEAIINPVQKVKSPTLEDLIDEEFL